VDIASIVLHTGVSSLEVEVDKVEQHPLYPEPYCVPAAAAGAVNRARAEGRRVIALGTTVVRALESAQVAEKSRAGGHPQVLLRRPKSGIRSSTASSLTSAPTGQGAPSAR